MFCRGTKKCHTSCSPIFRYVYLNNEGSKPTESHGILADTDPSRDMQGRSMARQEPGPSNAFTAVPGKNMGSDGARLACVEKSFSEYFDEYFAWRQKNVLAIRVFFWKNLVVYWRRILFSSAYTWWKPASGVNVCLFVADHFEVWSPRRDDNGILSFGYYRLFNWRVGRTWYVGDMGHLPTHSRWQTRALFCSSSTDSLFTKDAVSRGFLSQPNFSLSTDAGFLLMLHASCWLEELDMPSSPNQPKFLKVERAASKSGFEACVLILCQSRRGVWRTEIFPWDTSWMTYYSGKRRHSRSFSPTAYYSSCLEVLGGAHTQLQVRML